MKLAAVIFCLSAAALGQSALPAFEVASVKAHALGPGPIFAFSSSGPRVQYGAYPILGLIMEAYDLKRERVAFTSLPPDADSTYYEIAAKAEGDGARSRAEFRLMLQTLLAERFRLKIHWESRKMPVYALVVAKGGPKLKDSTADTDRFFGGVNGRNQYIEAKRLTMDQLTRHLTDFLGVDRLVVDRTGLKGAYDVRLEATPEWRLRNWEPGDLSVFTDVQEQLGLKLEPAKAPIEVLVVDRVEPPSGN